MTSGRFFKTLKTGDLAIIAAVLLAAAAALVLPRIGASAGTLVSVSVDGTVLHTLSLSAADTLDIRGPAGISRVIIQNGSVRVDEAPCPQQTCRAVGAISRAGQSIICVPNRLVIKVEGEQHSGVDAVTM